MFSGYYRWGSNPSSCLCRESSRQRGFAQLLRAAGTCRARCLLAGSENSTLRRSDDTSGLAGARACSCASQRAGLGRGSGESTWLCRVHGSLCPIEKLYLIKDFMADVTELVAAEGAFENSYFGIPGHA